jgi:glycosyltransferase involved in cell wall biosynthesis
VTKPTLSILIPTHNRAHTLPRLLASIEAQIRPDVEIIIADNASDDDTAACVKAFIAKHVSHSSQWRYLRSSRNLGFDTNLLRCVSCAEGGVGWFVGSDDWLYHGALARVLDSISKAPGAIIVGNTCDHKVTGELVGDSASTSWPDQTPFFFDIAGSVSRYLEGVRSVRGAFGFISNFAFPISAWPMDAERWVGTGYAHMLAAWAMALSGTPLFIRDRIFVNATIGHPERRDAETAEGVRIDTEAVRQLLALLPCARDRNALRAVWGAEYPEWRVASLEQRCHGQPAWLFTRAGLENILQLREHE